MFSWLIEESWLVGGWELAGEQIGENMWFEIKNCIKFLSQ